MAKNYVVVVDGPIPLSFRDGFFPRDFHYKKDANELVQEVIDRGGKAHVIPKSQFTPDLFKLFSKGQS